MMVIEKEVINEIGKPCVYELPDDYYDERKMKIEVVDTRSGRVIYRYEAEGTLEDPKNERESGDRVEDFKKRVDYYLNDYYRLTQNGSLPMPYLPYNKQRVYCLVQCAVAVKEYDLNEKAGWECFEFRYEGIPRPPELRDDLNIPREYALMKSRDAEEGLIYIPHS